MQRRACSTNALRDLLAIMSAQQNQYNNYGHTECMILTLLEASFHTGSIGLTGNISGFLHPIDLWPLALGIPHFLAYTANHMNSTFNSNNHH